MAATNGNPLDYVTYLEKLQALAMHMSGLEATVLGLSERLDRVVVGTTDHTHLVQENAGKRIESLEKLLDGQLQHLYPWITSIEKLVGEALGRLDVAEVDLEDLRQLRGEATWVFHPPAQMDEAMDKLSERLADLEAQCATEAYHARQSEKHLDFLLGRVQTLEKTAKKVHDALRPL